MARYIRTKLFRKKAERFDGRGHLDKPYQAILARISRFKKEWEDGKYEHLLNTKPLDEMNKKERREHRQNKRSKSVKPNARGSVVLNDDYEIEEELMIKIRDLWERGKRVSRAVIFRLALEIDPTFKVSGGDGGKGSVGHLKRLKQWFYFGFKRRKRLSNRKIASIGQKLPRNWERHLENLQKRIAAAQLPQTIELKSGECANVPGIDDEDFYNFDHVPVWQEPVASTSWGEKDSGRRNVKTAGKEKNRYTVVLTISKSGKKLPPLIIFKGNCLCIFNVIIMSSSNLLLHLIFFHSKGLHQNQDKSVVTQLPSHERSKIVRQINTVMSTLHEISAILLFRRQLILALSSLLCT